MLLVGAPMSKAGFAARFVGREAAPEDRPIVGVEFYAGRVQTALGSAPVQLWDTADDERFEALVPVFLRGADAVLYFANLCDAAGLAECRRQVQRCPAPEGAACVLVGNRPHDMPRTVPREEAEALADEFHLPYLECCVATGEGFDGIRDLIARCVVARGLVHNPRLEAVGAELQQLRQRRAQLERRLRVNV